MASFSKFSLATVEIEAGIQAAIVVSDKVYLIRDFEEQLKTIPNFPKNGTVLDLLQTWQPSLAALSLIAEGITSGSLKAQAAQSYKVLTPVRFPSKVACVGANYYEHLREIGVPVRKMEPMPYFFKPPTTTLVGPGPNVRKPRSTKEFDWELELVLVLGKRLRHAISLEEAADAIAGYAVGLDLSCRDLQMVKDLGLDVGRGKAQDTLAPCGPFFVPKHCLPGGIGHLSLKLWVNEQQMVNAFTNDMIWSPEEMLVEISKYMTLEPGDLVFTGAPPGTAKANGNRWLQPGDLIKAEIEGVGVLEVGVTEDV